VDHPASTHKKVYTLPKHLDEKWRRLHLGKIGVKLTSFDRHRGYISGAGSWRAIRQDRLAGLNRLKRREWRVVEPYSPFATPNLNSDK